MKEVYIVRNYQGFLVLNIWFFLGREGLQQGKKSLLDIVEIWVEFFRRLFDYFCLNVIYIKEFFDDLFSFSGFYMYKLACVFRERFKVIDVFDFWE